MRKVISLPGTLTIEGRTPAAKAKAKGKGKRAKGALVKAAPNELAPAAPTAKGSALLAKLPRWAWIAAALAAVGGAIYYMRRGRARRRRPFSVA